MKPQRLEQLYRQPLTRTETTRKQIPLERILNRSVLFYPPQPRPEDCQIVEIGPGTGDLLLHLSEKHPHKNILGIEMGKKRFEKIKERVANQRLKNVCLMHADARIPFYKNLIGNAAIEKCYVMFPDPWPKNKHRHLRLLQKDFVKKIAEKLKCGGEFTLVTDVKDYAGWAKENFLETIGAYLALTATEDLIHTFYHKKWLGLGRNFYTVSLRKATECRVLEPSQTAQNAEDQGAPHTTT